MYSKSFQHSIVKKTVPIVYEDESLCIINKPCGIPVQGGANISVSLIDIVSRQLGVEIFPVHRLDKETAGLLVTAKTAEAAHSCRLLFDSRKVEKEYIAFCFGGCSHGITAADSPYKSGQNRTEYTIDTPIMENGKSKPAVSSYRIIGGSDEYGLFCVRLHTGRMHQIRIHLAGIGHPIIGDDRHGDFKRNKELWKNARIKKLQLCAYRLRLPIKGKNRLFTTALPDHITGAIETLCPTLLPLSL